MDSGEFSIEFLICESFLTSVMPFMRFQIQLVAFYCCSLAARVWLALSFSQLFRSHLDYVYASGFLDLCLDLIC